MSKEEKYANQDVKIPDIKWSISTLFLWKDYKNIQNFWNKKFQYTYE